MPMVCTSWSFSVPEALVRFRLVCQTCGRSWQVESVCSHHAFAQSVIDRAISGPIEASHRECAPDRIGPDDEAWLREALR